MRVYLVRGRLPSQVRNHLVHLDRNKKRHGLTPPELPQSHCCLNRMILCLALPDREGTPRVKGELEIGSSGVSLSVGQLIYNVCRHIRTVAQLTSSR